MRAGVAQGVSGLKRGWGTAGERGQDEEGNELGCLSGRGPVWSVASHLGGEEG